MLARRTILLAMLALSPLVAVCAYAGPTSGINRAYMDTTCSPCADLYRYANGRFMDTADIPPAYSSIGIWTEMGDRNQAVLKSVLDRAAANADAEEDPTLAKLGHFYRSLTDSVRMDREEITPLAAELRFIDGLGSAADLGRAFQRYASLGIRFSGALVPFGFAAEVDPKNSATVIAQVSQGGLGLPDRDYYFRTDDKSAAQRDAYRAANAKLLAWSGMPETDARRAADAAFQLETALAESSLSRVQMRDPAALYHPMTVRELGALAPTLDWPAFFEGAGVHALAASDARLDVSMPGFVRGLNAQLTATPIETWRVYMKAALLRRYGPWLGHDAFQIAFDLQRVSSGQAEPQPLWKRATQACDISMGQALGKAFVAQAFPASSRERALEMVANFRAVFAERIDSRPWMSAATKQQAKAKLEAILQKIGYPDHWRDYSGLVVDPKGAAVANLMAAQRFEAKRQMAKIGRPTDRTEWVMTPPTVNAYYEPLTNEICFPAGILQPPRFDPAADDAANYGAIGETIGHELSHGFDDEGRQYDGAGNLRDWWTPEDAKEFKARADRVVAQYDAYVGVDTLHVNGRLTLGENLGDLGGLVLAYHAWQRSLKGKPSPVIDGFTAEQRFFIAHAQSWRTKMRAEAMRQRVLSNPHAPPVARTNGPASNMEEFRRAFGCKSGDPMVRDGDRRIEIW